jgi:hypothetical protein
VVVIGVGAKLFVQDTFDSYRSWAYVWTLLPALAGATLIYTGEHRRDEAERSKGRALLQWSIAGLVVLGALFELMLFDGGTSWGRFLVPVVLIGLGAVILLRRSSGSTANPNARVTPSYAGTEPEAPPDGAPRHTATTFSATPNKQQE